MEFLLYIIITLLVVGFGLLLYLLYHNRKDSNKDQSFLMLQNQLNEMSKVVDSKLSESHRTLQQQFGQSAKIITNVTEKLTKLDATNKQVLQFSVQLQRLQDILKNPKQRGVFGEYYLQTLLKNAFQPKQYKMQYKFQDGEIVDAVLFLSDKILPIDSKFSLENYNRIVEEHDPEKHKQLENTFKQDLKKRIDETAKYIRPQEGTTEYAVMFIPAEGIYYDLLINQVGALKVNTRDLIDYAINEKRVHIVSPTTFYVFLQTIIRGIRDYEVGEKTKEILKYVVMLGRHLNSYEDYLKKLGIHLGTTVSSYEKAYKEFAKIDKDVVKLTGKQKTVDPLPIERPNVEE